MITLVVGATGFLGGEICRRLAAKGHPVRGLVRGTSDSETVENLRSLGVELAEGDLRDRLSLDAACRDVEVVFSTATTTRSQKVGDGIEPTDMQGQWNLVNAARAAGVSRFIYVSFSGNIGFDDPLTTAKRFVEEQLRRSELTYTILRPSYFMEEWLSPIRGFDYPNAKATIYGSGQNKISWISLADVARFAVESLDNAAAYNAVIELGGPEALSPLEVVRIFEEVGGQPFEVEHVPEVILQQQAQSATDSLHRSLAALKLSYAKGDIVNMRKMLGIFFNDLTSVRDYASRTLASVPFLGLALWRAAKK
jgi:uncharacterized protein YbjT (DUF2867 family)